MYSNKNKHTPKPSRCNDYNSQIVTNAKLRLALIQSKGLSVCEMIELIGTSPKRKTWKGPPPKKCSKLQQLWR